MTLIAIAVETGMTVESVRYMVGKNDLKKYRLPVAGKAVLYLRSEVKDRLLTPAEITT